MSKPRCIILLIIYCAGVAAQNCLNSTCFELFRDPLRTFAQAASYCSSKLGGSLATVRDLDTQNFLSDLLLTEAELDWWVGGNETYIEEFLWADDAPFGVFSNWKHGGSQNPDSRRCIELENPDFAWIDEFCSTELGYVCEKESSSPAECNTSDSTQEDLYLLSTCYTVLYDKVSWYTAYEQCSVLHDGKLATVNSQAINDTLTTALQGLSKEIANNGINGFWIGLHSGQWRWTDGSSIESYFWSPGELVEVDSCLSMTLVEADPGNTYLWTADNCSESKGFICQTAFLTTTESLTTTLHDTTTFTDLPTATETMTTVPVTTTVTTASPVETSVLTTSPETTGVDTTSSAQSTSVVETSTFLHITTTSKDTTVDATPAATTQEVTTPEITTEEITTMEITTDEITTMGITSEEITTEEITAREITTTLETTLAQTSQATSSTDVGSTSIETPTTEDLTTPNSTTDITTMTTFTDGATPSTTKSTENDLTTILVSTTSKSVTAITTGKPTATVATNSPATDTTAGNPIPDGSPTEAALKASEPQTLPVYAIVVIVVVSVATMVVIIVCVICLRNKKPDADTNTQSKVNVSQTQPSSGGPVWSAYTPNTSTLSGGHIVRNAPQTSSIYLPHRFNTVAGGNQWEWSQMPIEQLRTSQRKPDAASGNASAMFMATESLGQEDEEIRRKGSVVPIVKNASGETVKDTAHSSTTASIHATLSSRDFPPASDDGNESSVAGYSSLADIKRHLQKQELTSRGETSHSTQQQEVTSQGGFDELYSRVIPKSKRHLSQVDTSSGSLKGASQNSQTLLINSGSIEQVVMDDSKFKTSIILK